MWCKKVVADCSKYKCRYSLQHVVSRGPATYWLWTRLYQGFTLGGEVRVRVQDILESFVCGYIHICTRGAKYIPRYFVLGYNICFVHWPLNPVCTCTQTHWYVHTWSCVGMLVRVPMLPSHSHCSCTSSGTPLPSDELRLSRFGDGWVFLWWRCFSSRVSEAEPSEGAAGPFVVDV